MFQFSLVLLSAVDVESLLWLESRVSAFAAVPAAVNLLSATCVCIVAGLPLLLASMLMMAYQLLLVPLYCRSLTSLLLMVSPTATSRPLLSLASLLNQRKKSKYEVAYKSLFRRYIANISRR
jgi:hypothetical protein